ncbi:MAG TPA: YqiA/YcfP family alpha/beta fold hydrolase [Acidiferrobacterales bacterium]
MSPIRGRISPPPPSFPDTEKRPPALQSFLTQPRHAHGGVDLMFIYLHGFNSGGASQKAAWLRERLAPIPVLSPTYPAHRGVEAATFLLDYIERARREHPDERKLVLIGSSLGGFWAQWLAPRVGAALVLINPALKPDAALDDVVGPQRNEATGEEYVLTAEQVRALRAYRIEPCDPAVPTLVLLDEGDELLDSRATAGAYRGCGEILLFPGGSHRFDHLAESKGAILALHETR